MALVNDVVRVNFLSQLASGQDVSNTFHIANQGSGVPDLATLQDLANDIDTYFTTTYRAILGTGDTLLAIRTYQQDDDNPPGPYQEYVLNKNLAGTATKSGSAPDMAVGLIKLQTSVAKRYARGHMFAPGLFTNTDFSNGDLINGSGAYHTALAALASKYETGCTVTPSWTGSTLSDWSLAIYSKVQDKVPGNIVTICSNAVADTKVHWLRSRGRGSV